MKGKTVWILGGILGLAFVLRIIGIQFGLPHLYQADEPIVVNHALAYGTGDLNPHFFKIPPLVSYLLFVFYGVSFVAGKALGVFKNPAEFEALFFGNPSFFYLSARVLFGALAGTYTVFLLFSLVKRHFSETLALVTSFFLAVCFLHVRDSHYVYVDIPLLLVLTASFFPILRLAEGDSSWRTHLTVGACLGLAVATKYNGVVLVVPYLAASLVGPLKERLISRWLGAAGMSLLVYSVLNPFTWLDFNFFWREIQEQARAEGGSAGLFHHLTYSLNGGVGPLLWGAALFGIVLTLFKGERKKLITASFLGAYYLLIGFKSQPYDRYVLPLLPFLLIFSAEAVLWLSRQIPEAWQKAALVFLVCLVASPSLAKAVLVDRILLAEDLRTVAKKWVEGSIEPGTAIALDWEFFQPRLRFSEKQLEEKRSEAESAPYFSGAQKERLAFLTSNQDPGESYELYFLSDDPGEKRFSLATPTVSFDLEELKKRNVRYVLIARTGKGYEHPEFYQALHEKGELIQRFSPYRDPEREYPFDIRPLTGAPFLWKELVARERNGQPIEVFKLK